MTASTAASAFGAGLPAPTPGSTGLRVVDHEPRCEGTKRVGNGEIVPCRRILGRTLTRYWCIPCPRCGHINERR